MEETLRAKIFRIERLESLMGSICCCFHVPDAPDTTDPSYQDCLCPKCCIQKFLNKHMNQFGTREGANASVLPIQQVASSNSEAVINDSSTASRSHGGAIENSSSFSSRHLQEQQNVLRGRQEKNISRSCVQPEPVRPTDNEVNSKYIQGDISVSSVKVLSSSLERFTAYTFPSPNEEDVCPICLEEYTPENPKIIMKCTHQYHLGCIYEWMERSENCPVCAKLMLFDESS